MSRFERATFRRDKLPNPSAAVVYNERAGDARKARKFKLATDNTIARLRDYDLSIPDYTPTQSANHAEDLVGKAIEKKRGLIIVKGGDATFSPIAHQVANGPHGENNPHLLSLGGGTENVFLKSITDSRYTNPSHVAQAALFHGHPLGVDVGRVHVNDTVYPFMANAGFGMDAEMLHRWEHREQGRPKKRKRELFRTWLENKDTYEPFDLTIMDETKQTEQQFIDAIALLMVNAGKYGGRFPITRSRMDDGEIDGVVAFSEAKQLPVVGGILFDSQFRYPSDDLEHISFQDITVTPQDVGGRQMYFQHDGEPQLLESDSFRVDTIPKGATVWVSKRVR